MKNIFYAFVWSFNDSKPEPFDVIAPLVDVWKAKAGKKASYWGYDEKVKKNRPQPTTMEELEAWIKSMAMYMWWSKCEYEMIVTRWPPREKEDAKVDVYQQILPNLKLITRLVAEEINFVGLEA